MGERDLKVVAGAVKERPDYVCLLTGRPCGLQPVRLRRMFLLPFLWVGWKADMILPLDSGRSLAAWQYLRMLRPYLALFGGLALVNGLLFLIGPGAGRFGVLLLPLPVVAWFAIGRLLDSREFVRLLSTDKASGTATIRFATEDMARQAATVLVFPEDVDLSTLPVTRDTIPVFRHPAFRWILLTLAVAMLIFAGVLWFTVPGTDGRDAAMGVLLLGAIFGALGMIRF